MCRNLFQNTALLTTLFFSFAAAADGQTTTVFFDNSGAELGITPLSTTDFSYEGSNWSGGVVQTEGILALYASVPASWETIVGSTAEVTFDDPVSSVDFFFVDGFGFPAGTATAFDASDAVVATADSLVVTFLADPNNFVTLSGAEPIVRVEFVGGVIDNFSYTLAPVIGDLEFSRGDCNNDGGTDIADAVFLLSNILFPTGTPTIPACADACDGNDDGVSDIADAIAVLSALFAGGVLPAPTSCDVDPTIDSLDCGTFDNCP